jgi:uncharacterized SAM-binding protein YcdF (DUF218 family)
LTDQALPVSPPSGKNGVSIPGRNVTFGCYIREVGLIRRHPGLTAVLAVVLGAVAILATTGFAVWQAAHHDDASRIERADVIAVLGAAQYDGRPSATFEARLRQGALLYEKGFSQQILVLGGGQPGDRTTEAEAGRGWLIDTGVPAESVHAEPQGSTTLESLRAAATWMDQRSLRSVFLVSDPWHNLRIKKMASDLGLTPLVSATFRSAAQSRWTRLSGYTRETFAYLAYRVLGQ